MRVSITIAAALAFLLAGRARAAEWPEANPGRPSFSSNAPTTAKGALELETGLVVVSGGDSVASTLKFGAWDTFDFRLNWSQDVRPETATELSAQVKWLLSSPDAPLEFALSPYVGIPTSSDSGYDFGNAFIAQYTTGGFEIDANLVVDVAGGNGSDAAVELFPVVTLGHDVVGDLGGFVETHAEIPVEGGQIGYVASAGLGYALYPSLVLDTAIDLGLDDAVPSWQFQVGLTASMYVARPHH